MRLTGPLNVYGLVQASSPNFIHQILDFPFGHCVLSNVLGPPVLCDHHPSPKAGLQQQRSPFSQLPGAFCQFLHAVLSDTSVQPMPDLCGLGYGLLGSFNRSPCFSPQSYTSQAQVGIGPDTQTFLPWDSTSCHLQSSSQPERRREGGWSPSPAPGMDTQHIARCPSYFSAAIRPVPWSSGSYSLHYSLPHTVACRWGAPYPTTQPRDDVFLPCS